MDKEELEQIKRELYKEPETEEDKVKRLAITMVSKTYRDIYLKYADDIGALLWYLEVLVEQKCEEYAGLYPEIYCDSAYEEEEKIKEKLKTLGRIK